MRVWYIHCLNRETNASVSELVGLCPDTKFTDSRFMLGAKVVYPKKREREVNLIELTKDQKDFILDQSGLNFELFAKEGNGQIRFCPTKYARRRKSVK